MRNTTDDETVRRLRETFAQAERLVTDDHPLPVTQTSRSRWLVLGAAAVALAAATLGQPHSATPVGGSPSATTATTTARTDDRVVLYSAVIREIIANDRPASGWPVLYVLDAPRKDSAQGTFTQTRGTPFDRATRDAIGAAVPEQIRWVSDNADAIQDRAECGAVKDQGVLVTVGEIHTVDSHLELRAGSWISCQAGHWLTYRFDRAGTGWRLTSTVGPQVVS
jgi:hypothetical protein